jgi:hypothetical protein
MKPLAHQGSANNDLQTIAAQVEIFFLDVM